MKEQVNIGENLVQGTKLLFDNKECYFVAFLNDFSEVDILVSDTLENAFLGKEEIDFHYVRGLIRTVNFSDDINALYRI